MGSAPLILLALLVLGTSLPAQAERPRTPAEQVAAILEGVKRPADASRGAGELARLGESAVEPLFVRLGRGEEDVARRAAILGALSRMPADPVLGFLSRLARGTPGEPERKAALDLLARLGRGVDLPLAFV